MNTFIKDTETLKDYMNVTGTFEFDNIMPYVASAQETYLKPYLGSFLYTSLLAYCNDDEAEADSAYDALLPYVRNTVAKFAFYQAVPMLNVAITSSGFGVVSNTNLAPASDTRVNAFRTALEIEGWNLMESMLAFLEENSSDYDEWTASEAFTKHFDTMINTAEQFDAIIHINKSRLEFQRLIPDMKNVETLRIEPGLSKTMCDEIRRQLKTDSLDAKYLDILTNIRRAIAYFTWVDAAKTTSLDRFKYEDLANAYLSAVKKVLDADLTTYDLYAASDSYDAAATTYDPRGNTADGQIYIF
jgi:hypothetical protein